MSEERYLKWLAGDTRYYGVVTPNVCKNYTVAWHFPDGRVYTTAHDYTDATLEDIIHRHQAEWVECPPWREKPQKRSWVSFFSEGLKIG